ncbi:hypothetical protein Ahy_A02g007184 isoform A [Arachis hypogaea]|uniref:Protein FAR1-RELATED SEQUENCE n=1 Tax=Arachis hypogaea TaxID=3818 RepID=A0A445EBQ3_ARAHY|nr:hypothetical protein Ahy_A02g007184 isoform A [Arachis hypogaea]
MVCVSIRRRIQPRVVIVKAVGFNMVFFTKQDIYNELRRQCAMQNGDGNATFCYLEGISQLFRQCMLVDIDIHEFEKLWDAMLDECNVREVEWIMDLHTKKYSWATSYIRGLLHGASLYMSSLGGLWRVVMALIFCEITRLSWILGLVMEYECFILSLLS